MGILDDLEGERRQRPVRIDRIVDAEMADAELREALAQRLR